MPGQGVGSGRCRPLPTECRAIPPTYPEGTTITVVARDRLAGVADPSDPRGPFVPAPASLIDWLLSFTGVLQVGETTSARVAGVDARQTDVTVADIPAGGATLPIWYFGDGGSHHASIENRTLMRFFELEIAGERIVITITALASRFGEQVAEAEAILATLELR